MRGSVSAVLFCVLLLTAAAALAQVHLRFDPPDTQLAVGESGRLSIRIDEMLEVRTLDVVVDYDTTVVRSLGGAEGTLYTDSGIFTFAGFEEDEPGTWHGYAVLMGAGLFVQGPGELYHWDFETLANGICPVTAVQVSLSMTDGSWYEDVLLSDGKVTVGSGSGTDPRVPAVTSGLRVAPNPFNPRTWIHFELDRSGPARLEVLDLRGREVAVLADRVLSAGPQKVEWSGRAANGRAVPSGIYLFRLRSSGKVHWQRGVLLR